jgi:hypothetical protein
LSGSGLPGGQAAQGDCQQAGTGAIPVRHASVLQKVIAQWRSQVEATFREISGLMELARHGARVFWGC